MPQYRKVVNGFVTLWSGEIISAIQLNTTRQNHKTKPEFCPSETVKQKVVKSKVRSYCTTDNKPFRFIAVQPIHLRRRGSNNRQRRLTDGKNEIRFLLQNIPRLKKNERKGRTILDRYISVKRLLNTKKRKCSLTRNPSSKGSLYFVKENSYTVSRCPSANRKQSLARRSSSSP